MKEQNIQKLKRIKGLIIEGVLPIAGQTEWDDCTTVLSNSGADLIDSIEESRKKIHDIRIALFFPLSRDSMIDMDTAYHELLQDYELFFDVSMRFLKTIIDGDRCTDQQHNKKQYIRELLDHSRKAIDYITNLVSKKSTEYMHCQTLFVALVATIMAFSSVLISLWALLGRS